MPLSRLKRAIGKEEYVAITGSLTAAIILNQLIYWSKRTKDHDKYYQEELEHIICPNPAQEKMEHGWIYKSARQLRQEIMLGCSDKTILSKIDILLEKGFLDRRNNPKKRYDRMYQYRVNFRNIIAALSKKHYTLQEPDFPFESDAELEDKGNQAAKASTRKRVVIKEEYTRITSDVLSAMILNQLVYWSERTSDYQDYVEEERSRLDDYEPVSINYAECGWISKSAAALKDELMTDVSAKTISRRLDWLAEHSKFIVRRNSENRSDHRYQYRVDSIKLAAQLKKHYTADSFCEKIIGDYNNFEMIRLRDLAYQEAQDEREREALARSNIPDNFSLPTAENWIVEDRDSIPDCFDDSYSDSQMDRTNSIDDIPEFMFAEMHGYESPSVTESENFTTSEMNETGVESSVDSEEAYCDLAFPSLLSTPASKKRRNSSVLFAPTNGQKRPSNGQKRRTNGQKRRTNGHHAAAIPQTTSEIKFKNIQTLPPNLAMLDYNSKAYIKLYNITRAREIFKKELTSFSISLSRSRFEEPMLPPFIPFLSRGRPYPADMQSAQISNPHEGKREFLSISIAKEPMNAVLLLESCCNSESPFYAVDSG